MKKNIIYTLCLLLSGAFFLGSCEDMLETESNRVDNEFGKISFNDSVYSVLGIVRSMQNVADREVVLGELRGDLVSVKESHASLDLQNISRFEFDLDNSYLDIKDYYTIINNCNIFLSRVDTTMERNNKKLMLREFVAVTSVRAWTYLQLAINYDRVRYFTKPLLTHGDVTEEMRKAPITRNELISNLITELTPYEDPRVYPMPSWTGVTSGNGVNIATEKLFMPIRMLLGELHLWRGMAGDYSVAANYFYKMLVDSPNNPYTSGYRFYTDNAYRLYFGFNNKGDVSSEYDGGFVGMFSEDNNSVLGSKGSALAVIPMQTTENTGGTVSLLNEIFFPDVAGMAQAVASPAYVGLSNRQVNLAYDATGVNKPKYNPSTEEYPGDLRRYEVTGAQRNYDTKEVDKNIIYKFNMPSLFTVIDNVTYATPSTHTGFVQLRRDIHIYLRFAEAVLGMERFEGFTFLKPNVKAYGGFEQISLAMEVLKNGIQTTYYVGLKNMTTEEVIATDENGNKLLNKEGGDSIEVQFYYTPPLKSYSFLLNTTTGRPFDNNSGVHSRGVGDSEHNAYYMLNDTCIARYLDILPEAAPDGTIDMSGIILTKEDSMNYVADILLDELALEFCFEGQRFGDLIRFAKAAEAAGDPEWKNILAKRVAGRAYENSVSFRSANNYQYDGGLHGFLSNESNWYLPFPSDEVVELPSEDEDTSSDNNDSSADDNVSGGDENGSEEDNTEEDNSNE